MKSLLFLLPVALLSNIGLRPAQGAFVHQAAAEFSDTVNTETSRWSYRFQTDATVHATHYPLLDQRIVTGRTYLPSRGDLSVWGLSGDPGAAWLGRQASGTVQTSGDPIQGLIFPSGEILARPGLNGLVVLTWLSPTTTVVNLQYRFADQEDAPACGNGIHWSIERGVELLAGGAFGPGGDTGVTNLANVVVHAGDRLHFIVAAAGDASCDATLIQATVSEPVDEAVYDAAADLLRDETLPGAQNGTNGVWIYGGYNPSLATFTPFSRAQHLDNWPATLQKGTFQGYSSVAGDGTPTLVVNTNRTVAQTPCCGITPIAPGQILMHPSSPGGGNFGDTYDVPTLRWTAPADGTAQVTANFLQRHGLAQRGHLLTNGMPALTGVASRDTGTTLSLTGLVVRTGDTIDVALAPGPSGYGSGSTETSATITFSALGIGRPIVIVTEPPDQTVEENRPALFAVQVNNALAHFQWQRDGVDIPGANSSSYTLSSAPLAANQATFTCLMTNLVSTNLTRSARLTVLRDTSAPTISSVQNDGPQNLVVTFSEPIAPNSATNLANYTLDRGVTINAVNLGTDERSVILKTSPLLLELPSQLTVTGIRDLASVPNLIAPDTRFSFIPKATCSRPLAIQNLPDRPPPPTGATISWPEAATSGGAVISFR